MGVLEGGAPPRSQTLYPYNLLDQPEVASSAVREETLDPQDWEALRALARRMVDDGLEYLQTVRERPVWSSPPAEVRQRLQEPAPRAPQGLEAAYRDFKDDVLPYPTGNIHPRFWGWVIGTGTPSAALAELLAGVMNSSVSTFDTGPALVELQVLSWLKELFGFPAEAGGLLVSGGSMANFLGLAIARNLRAPFDVRQSGLAGGPPLTVYASTETHNSVRKAIEALGLGRDGLRSVPVDGDYRVDLRALARLVAEDRAAGRAPVAVVGNAGTVNTGATDDLGELADFCARQGLWLHVDGAFGALAALDPELRTGLAGLERADSLAFDLHKWGYMPVEVGCVLVRREQDLPQAFAAVGDADYLRMPPRGINAAGTHVFSDHGLQLSRGFRALKVWMAFKEHGLDAFARLVRQNVEQARFLAQRVAAHPELELMAPVPLNVVCFRYRGRPGQAVAINDVNRTLLGRLQESGVAVPSSTVLRGALALRVANTNHRTRRGDLDLLVDEVVRLGRELTGGGE
jgi:glutamate/tyrosine decarboxylase-like PLP-dependent enzyme